MAKMAFLSVFGHKLTPETGVISFQGLKRATRPEFIAQVGWLALIMNYKVNINEIIIFN